MPMKLSAYKYDTPPEHWTMDAVDRKRKKRTLPSRRHYWVCAIFFSSSLLLVFALVSCAALMLFGYYPQLYLFLRSIKMYNKTFCVLVVVVGGSFALVHCFSNAQIFSNGREWFIIFPFYFASLIRFLFFLFYFFV